MKDKGKSMVNQNIVLWIDDNYLCSIKTGARYRRSTISFMGGKQIKHY